MPRLPRSQVIDRQAVGLYHCWNQFVRQLRLAGFDPVTGLDYSGRKVWFVDRLELLARIFLVDMVGHSIESTHFHVILRNRPDLAGAISDREVVRRWRALCPLEKNEDGSPRELTDEELEREVGNGKRVAEWRDRLSDISWFMKVLCEVIARRANLEDRVSGAFFARRFDCKRLKDEAAVLACLVYVELNEIRAGLADRPETSRFSSIWKRLQARQRRRSRQEARAAWAATAALDERQASPAAPAGPAPDTFEVPEWPAELAASGGVLGDGSSGAGWSEDWDELECAEPGDEDEWLCPVDESRSLPCLNPFGRATEFRPDVPAGLRLRRQGALPITQDEFLELVDWSGRQVPRGKEGQVGVIPAELAPILERLGVRPEKWSEVTSEVDNWFAYVMGRAEGMLEFAKRANLAWVKGLRQSRQVFT